MKNRKSQRGSGVFLLELVIVMSLILVLAGQHGLAFVKLQAAQNGQTARTRLQQISQAVNAETICNNTPGCVPSPALMNIIPAAGALTQTGYTYTMQVNPDGTWSYTAAPMQDGWSGAGSFYVDQTGVVRCLPVNQGQANAGSQPCQ